MKFARLLVLILLFNYCFAGTIDPNVPDERYLEYGKKFVYVAKVVGDGEYYASAVIINKNTFLTSAHVASKIKKIIVEKEDDFFEYEISEVVVNKDYKKYSHNNDIAVGKIKGDFSLDFYPELYKDKNEIGKVVCICGYGASGNFSTGKNKDDKKRRAGSNKIHETTKDILFCSADDSPKTDLEFIICHGDSGGGLFINNKLAGLNCFIEPRDGTYNSNYSDKSGYVRISKHIDWIENYK